MSWLLHTRRVPLLPNTRMAPQDSAERPVSQHKCAGIGNTDEVAHICYDCATCLCVEDKLIKMPRFALSNAMWLGRQHPLLQNASLGVRLLLGLGRPCFRKLLLGKGRTDEREAGTTGNHILVSQGAPSISEVLPPSSRQLSDSFVAVFGQDKEDLAKCHVLKVSRNDYKILVEERVRVNCFFARTKIDEQAVETLPENGVPQQLMECGVQMAEVEKYTATRCGPGTVRDPLDPKIKEDDDASDETSDAGSSDSQTENANRESPKTCESQLNQCETPLGLDPTAAPDFVQQVASFKAQLGLVHDAVKQMRSAAPPAEASEQTALAEAAAEEQCFRAVVDLREVAQKLNKHQFAEKAKLLDNAENKAMFVPGNKLLSMFDSATWTQCLAEFWYGDALPNMSQLQQNPQLTFEELFEALPDREELEYQLDSDSTPYCALSKSRFDTPEHVIIFGDTLRRLLLFRGTRMALKRKGFQKDVKLIANSTSEQCVAALQSSAGQPGDVKNASMEVLSNNEKISLELRTALRQVLISTRDVPMTDGYKRNLRHESHNLNVTEGALVVFATFNFADTYSPLLFQLVRGGPGGSVEHIGHDIEFRLTDDAPEMPSLQQMHQLIAQSPRAQAKFFLLMDDIADIYFMGMDQSFIGRHHVQQSFHHKHREDSLASTAMPSLGGYGVAELEPFESQERGFQHGHRKKYAIPKNNEREIIEKFKNHNQTELHDMFQDLKGALLRCAETLQYEASTLPAEQMGQTVWAEKFTLKQQKQSRLDGGIELDGTRRQHLLVTAQELPGHHELEKRRAHAEGRPPVSMYSEASLQGCHQSLMPSYRLPQNLGTRKVLDEAGMHFPDEDAAPGAAPEAFPPLWVIDGDGETVGGPRKCPNAANLGSVPQPASSEDIVDDAKQFALSFGRDFRALHQLNHDHDCHTTCLKNVTKQCKEAAQEALRKGKVVMCRFFFYHIVVFNYVATALHGLGKSTTKRIRRRGKKLVKSPYIATTNERNEFCKPVLRRDTPFRSASTDVGQNWARCNTDFQFMPRTIDPSHFMEAGAEQPAVVQVNPKDALAMYGVRRQMSHNSMLRRTFHTIVAMFQAAHNCDYYITKYHAKPVALLQSLLTNIALGLRRLEAEDEAAEACGEQPVNDAKERARRTTLKIANAGNRSSWCSCCEMACFIKTGSLARKTHRCIAIFLSRPKYLFEECRRLLQSSSERLIEPQMPRDDQARYVDVLCFSKRDTDNHHINESDTHSAVLPVAMETDAVKEEEDVEKQEEAEEDEEAEKEEEDADSNASEEDPKYPTSDTAGINNDDSLDARDLEEDLDISALEATTSAHDDWLHRGPFLFDMDFHTYMRFTVRRLRPKEQKVCDVDRAQHCFFFDEHYALSTSHWQQLITDGHSKLVVMEALKCSLPTLNNGEDNAVFKSLIGTLIKCPGKGHCADPLLCKAGFFQVTVPESQTPTSELHHWIHPERRTPYPCPLCIDRTTHADSAAATFSCRLQWKARRAEIELLAKQAADLSNDAKRIPVLADTTLLRGFHDVRPSTRSAAPPTWRFLICFTQVWMQKCGQAFPRFAHTVLDYMGNSIHHPHQLSLAQFSAYHLREVIYNLDMLAIARTTKLTAASKETIENEEPQPVPAREPLGETEFYGGEQIDEPPISDEVASDSWCPMFSFPHAKLTAILCRESEVKAARKKGRKSAALLQMKCFDECFHTVLNTPVQPSEKTPQKVQLSYVQPESIAHALLYQDSILQEMRTAQNSGETKVDPNSDIGEAVLHNLKQRSRTAEWIDLPTALQGPAAVARRLIKKLQDERSTPKKPYRVNKEQLECTALFVEALEKAFEKRPNPAEQWLHPAEVLMTIITDGGGGCGKTTLATEVILPLLETYYHPEGVLRRAPSNKPARLIDGRTMHSGQGLTPENSMRTAALALNAQSQQKLSITHADAGVLYIDESSQLQAELNHAAALRTTYARETKYGLCRNNYSGPRERYGRIAFLWYSQDHLQLPPVPETSSMLASWEGTTPEHKVGAKIFRNAERIFQFNTSMRFTDDTLIQILEAMRTPGGKKLSDAQWQAVRRTERRAQESADASAERSDEANSYHVCYCWSAVTMAAFMLARVSARKSGQTLFYTQAIDQALAYIPQTKDKEFYEELLKIPSLSSTKRLPAVALWHHGMRMKFSTTLQQPHAVQDSECTVVGFEPDERDYAARRAMDAQHCLGEYVCQFLPKAIYVVIDKCEHHFLPPVPCPEHRMTGYEDSCLNCNSGVQPGLFAVKPVTRTFRYHYDPQNKTKYVNIQRKQFPLTPAAAMPLYSMQGVTADPHMTAYWFFPQRCSATVQWLIVYVMLSRPRSLAALTSIGLTEKVRDIIEKGPPEDLVATFHKLFDEKIKTTKDAAMRAAELYELLPGRIE